MHALSIAPMIDWTNSPFRRFMRMLAPKALLYTEMQTTGAIAHNPSKALYFQKEELPLALQIGGSDIAALQGAAVAAMQQGFTELNLNCGCPSDKVLAGQFGACLMQKPQLVAKAVQAMKEAVSIPVTVKTRIGIDHEDSYAFFSDFVHAIVAAGCDKLIVHARKAWLSGLNPKQNRSIPPINYDYVYAIKEELPGLAVVINGNIKDCASVLSHLKKVDGVMLGRLACENPFALAGIHQALYPEEKPIDRNEVLDAYRHYVNTSHAQGVKLSLLFKPLLTFAHGLPGSKKWKQGLMMHDLAAFNAAVDAML